MVFFSDIENAYPPISWQICLKLNLILAMITLKLYGTSACHLCESAEALLVSINNPDIRWEVIEISEDDFLLATYGTRIPVLLNTTNFETLDWPFNQVDIIRLATPSPVESAVDIKQKAGQ
ncbi:MAG: hypothetical protein RL194_163 [Pseudomonadota bacterium]